MDDSDDGILPGLSSQLMGLKKGDKYAYLLSPQFLYKGLAEKGSDNSWLDISLRKNPSNWLVAFIEINKIKTESKSKNVKKNHQDIPIITASPVQNNYQDDNVSVLSNGSKEGHPNEIVSRMAKLSGNLGQMALVLNKNTPSLPTSLTLSNSNNTQTNIQSPVQLLNQVPTQEKSLALVPISEKEELKMNNIQTHQQPNYYTSNNSVYPDKQPNINSYDNTYYENQSIYPQSLINSEIPQNNFLQQNMQSNFLLIQQNILQIQSKLDQIVNNSSTSSLSIQNIQQQFQSISLQQQQLTQSISMIQSSISSGTYMNTVSPFSHNHHFEYPNNHPNYPSIKSPYPTPYMNTGYPNYPPVSPYPQPPQAQFSPYGSPPGTIVSHTGDPVKTKYEEVLSSLHFILDQYEDLKNNQNNRSTKDLEATNEINRLKLENEQLKSQLEESLKKIDDSKNMVANIEKEYEITKNELESVEFQILNSNNEIETLNIKNLSLETEVIELKNKVEKGKESTQALQKSLDEATASLITANAAAETAKAAATINPAASSSNTEATSTTTNTEPVPSDTITYTTFKESMSNIYSSAVESFVTLEELNEQEGLPDDAKSLAMFTTKANLKRLREVLRTVTTEVLSST